jgi:hypothetical protein
LLVSYHYFPVLKQVHLILVSRTRLWPSSTCSAMISSNTSRFATEASSECSPHGFLPRHSSLTRLILFQSSLHTQRSLLSHGMRSKHLCTACLILPGALAKHVISEGTKSVTSTCLPYPYAYCAVSDSACRILRCPSRPHRRETHPRGPRQLPQDHRAQSFLEADKHAEFRNISRSRMTIPTWSQHKQQCSSDS